LNTRNVVGALLLAVLAGGLGYRFYSRGLGRLGAAPSQVTTAFRTEEQWIVGQVARDLDEMARFARTGQPSASTQSPVSLPDPSEGPWSFRSYEPFAKALLQAQGVVHAPAPPSTDEALLDALTDLGGGRLARESVRLSEALRRDFTNPDRHEEAALLVGAFALREAEGHFADARASLGRMTAHLTLSGALRGSPDRSLSGTYAEILHASLTRQSALALELIGKLPGEPSSAQAAWRSALTLRTTQDWRSFPDVSEGTLLERLEYLRALVATRSAAEVRVFLEKADPGNQADWNRIVSTAHLGVELGNLTVLPGLTPLVAEIGEVRATLGLPPVADDALVKELNRPPRGCIGSSGPQILDWGAWAAFYSRAILEHVADADTHLRRVQGAAGAADAYQKEMTGGFGRVRLYPVVTTHWTRGQEMNLDRIADAITVAIDHPQLVTAHNWGQLEYAQRYEPVRRGMPRSAEWFRTAIPRGTAFDARYRLEELGHAPRTRPDVEALAAIDPHDFAIDMSLVRVRHGARPTLAQLQAILGGRAGFDSRAAEALAKAGAEAGGPEQERVLAANCQRSAPACFDLAHHLVDEGRDEEAAATFERAIGDPSVDRVLAASHSRWLIDYHFRQGHQDRALRLANEAAETGSYSGLSFRARLLEQMERYDGAESDFEAMAERYDNNSSLVAFHYRMARGRGRAEFEAKLRRSARALFPNGLEKVGDPGGKPPLDGAYVMGHSPELLKAGLRAGDVIVGVDGWRIRTAGQYEAVVRFDRADAMIFTVWRGGYQQLRATVKDRWLGVRLVDFPVKGWVAGKREVNG
jgi:tetratricopeptide (TPR) repeat protein